MMMVKNVVIDISDDDINGNEDPKGNTFPNSSDPGALAKSVCSTKNNLEMTYEDDMDGFQRHSRNIPLAKRKRTSYIVISDNENSNADEEEMNVYKGHSSNTRSTKREEAVTDGETSYDDHAPISILITRHCRYETKSEDEVKENARKQRLTRLRKLKSKNKEDNSNTDEEHVINTRSAQRKIAAKMSTSDDDNAPICTLIEPHSSRYNTILEEEVEEDTSKKHLTRLRTSKSKIRQVKSSLNLKETNFHQEFSLSEENYDGIKVGRESESKTWDKFRGDTSESLGASNDTSDNENCKADEENTKDISVPSSNTRSAKRKRAAKINRSEVARKQHPMRLRNRQHKSSFESKKTISLDEVSSSEENYDGEVGSEIEDKSLNESIGGTSESLGTSNDTSDNENCKADNVPSSNTRSAKRKRAAKISTNEGESKQRRTRLGKSESENRVEENSCDLNKTIDLYANRFSDDDDDDEENDGVDEELDGDREFIDDSSEKGSDCTSRSGDRSDEPEDAIIDYKETIDKIRGKKITNVEWVLQADMLADFGKDPELCMRAVCALYRQQTADEKTFKEAKHRNNRGFSQTDAFRASKLAEFLTDGDSNGDLNRTVEELERYDLMGIELCTKLAKRYSNQLFEIYKKKEDPYFLPH